MGNKLKIIIPLIVLKLDHSPVAQVRIPGHARIWKLPPPSASPRGWCPGDSSLPVSNAKIHRHRTRGQPGRYCSCVYLFLLLQWGVPTCFLTLIWIDSFTRQIKEEGDRQEMMDPAEGMLAFCLSFESGAMRLLTSCLKLAVSPVFCLQPSSHNQESIIMEC